MTQLAALFAKGPAPQACEAIVPLYTTTVCVSTRHARSNRISQVRRKTHVRSAELCLPEQFPPCRGPIGAVQPMTRCRLGEQAD
jgi:hypothetical protein